MTSPARPGARYGGKVTGQHQVPDRLYMQVPGGNIYLCRQAAMVAVAEARRYMPKVSGAGAASLKPLYGRDFFGLTWADDYVWWQEVGINPFTMRALAGKLIPMWINDPTGKEQQANPKAKVRTTLDGRVQVLIFRRAAKMGARKNIRLPDGSPANVPQSYPGAPGRIAVRESRLPYTREGRVAGRIGARPLAFRNVGVRWRHPGLSPRTFLYRGMIQAAAQTGIEATAVYATTERWR